VTGHWIVWEGAWHPTPRGDTSVTSDPNTSLRNPELLEALRRMATHPSREAEAGLLRCLNEATYLAAILVEGAPVEGPGSGADLQDGQEVAFQRGASVPFVSARSGGRNFLPLFTDFRAIRLYTPRGVAGMILPAIEAWSLILDNFDGAVINPANDALPLLPELIQSLQATH
jgi:hypothetical protein